MDIKEQLIKEGLFRKDGNLNSSKFKYLSKKYDLSTLKGDTLAEKFYLLFKGNQPSCIICGKPSQFRSYYWGYSFSFW